MAKNVKEDIQETKTQKKGKFIRQNRNNATKRGMSKADTAMTRADVQERKDSVESKWRKNSKAGNDPGWYKFNDQIYEESGKLNYYARQGFELNGNQPVGTGYYATTIPTLMTIEFLPTIGSTQEGSAAPINQATFALYRAIQRRVQKKLDFAPCDLAIYIMCMDSVFMTYAYLCRLYALNNTFKSMDPTIPSTFYKAMGFDPDTMTNQLGWEDFKAELDIWAATLGNFAVPKGFKVMERHYWMCANVFTDAPLTKNQFYMFSPGYCYRFINNGGDLGAYASLQPWPFADIAANGLRGIMDYARNMANYIMADADTALIQSWILRAYESPSELMTVGLLADGATLTPQYVAEILPQIHNMDICGQRFISGVNQGNIVQTEYDTVSQVILTEITGTRAFGHLCFDNNKTRIIDVPMDNPSTDSNYVATRLKVTIDESATIFSPGSVVIKPQYYGTEIVTQVKINRGLKGSDTITLTSNGLGMNCSGSLTTTIPLGTFTKDYLNMATASHFYMGPIMYLTNDGPSEEDGSWNTNPTWLDFIGDAMNYTTYTRTDLKKLHASAVMGEFLRPEDFLA